MLSCRGDSMTGRASESLGFLRISCRGVLREGSGSALAIMGAEGGGGSVNSRFCGSRSRPIVTVIKTIKATAAAGGAQIQRMNDETAGVYWTGYRSTTNGGTGIS